MKYLIGTVALIFSIILSLMIAYCIYRAFNGDMSWAFVMLGLILPDALALIIAQAAFHAVRDY